MRGGTLERLSAWTGDRIQDLLFYSKVFYHRATSTMHRGCGRHSHYELAVLNWPHVSLWGWVGVTYFNLSLVLNNPVVCRKSSTRVTGILPDYSPRPPKSSDCCSTIILWTLAWKDHIFLVTSCWLRCFICYCILTGHQSRNRCISWSQWERRVPVQRPRHHERLPG